MRPTLIVMALLSAFCAPVFAQGTMDDTSFSLRDVIYICTLVVTFTGQFIFMKVKIAHILKDQERIDKRIGNAHDRIDKNQQDDEGRREKIGTLTTYVKILGEKAGVKVEDL